ncbi:MAG: calcium-translocating P-type ATPase, SERCA-type [Candidatus Aenigmatarchaeota archaeon]
MVEKNYSGLTSEDAKKLLEEFGYNKLREKKGRSALMLLAEQFFNFLIIILIIASVVSVLLGEIIDAAAIIIIVILNAVLGFVQEYRAEKSLEALKKIVSPVAKVVRNGKETVIPASEIVPGDLITLDAGDKVPADCRILESFSIHADESALTGESLPVEKSADALVDENAPVADRKNKLFMGTVITYGRAKAFVEKTAMNTEIGKIADLIQEQKIYKTQLQEKLDNFGKDMAKVIFVAIFVIFALGVSGGTPVLRMFLASVSLAVAAIPEGLPAVVTTCLALGVYRMAKHNAIVRKLPAVETLGSTTVIVSDKTGTLTENEMTVKKIMVDNALYDVSGSGYSAEGKFLLDGNETEANEDLKFLLTTGMLCSNAAFSMGEPPEIVGDPTEVAILVAGAKASLDKALLDASYQKKFEVVFDSDKKRMSTVVSHDNGETVCMKGAADVIIKLCTKERKGGKDTKLTEKRRAEILSMTEKMASEALRVIAIAYKTYGSDVYEEDEIEKDMVFLGLVGMMDPPRPEVKESIEMCKRAGIKTMMITGDHKVTAIAIAKELGFAEGLVLTGEELEKLTDEEFEKIVENVYVYARMSPQHKTRIVKMLQKKGEIVAMTGDGVNDAPALRMADIGIAMGVTGTDVAKEASTMVLADDNFATIVSAVREGRGIYDNIKKFVFYLLSCNVGEVLTVFFAILLRLPLPLAAVQILWMNLLTDGLPALALGVQPTEKDVMYRKPRPKTQEILDKKTLFDIILVGIAMSIGTLYLFVSYLPDIAKAMTVSFTTIVFFQLFHAFSCQSDKSLLKAGIKNKYLALALAFSAILQLAVIYVPFLDPVFETVSLSAAEMAEIVFVSFLIIPFVEAIKFFGRRAKK